MSDSDFLYHSVSLSPSSQFIPSFSSQLLLTFPSSSLPFHSINIGLIHCIGYMALLKTLHSHFWWDVLPSHYDPHRLNNTFIFLDLYTYLNPLRLTTFSTDGVSDVKNLKYVFSGFCVVSVVWSVWVHCIFLRFLIFGLFQALFLSLVVKF